MHALTPVLAACLAAGLLPAFTEVSAPSAPPVRFAQADPSWKSLGNAKGSSEKADSKTIYFELEAASEVRVTWKMESEGRRPGLRITLASKAADADKKEKYKDAGVLLKTNKPVDGEKAIKLPPNKYRITIDYQDCWFRVEADGRPAAQK